MRIETLRVARVEAWRFARSRTAWVALFFLAALPALRVFMVRVAELTERSRRILAGRAAPAAATQDTGTAWGPFVDGWSAGLVLATLLLLIHASRSLAADRESWVLRLALTRRTPRVSVVLGRALFALVLVLGSAAVTGASAYLAARRWYEFGPLVEDGYTFFTAAELRAELVRSIRAVLPAIFTTWSLGLLVSTLAGSAAAAVGVSLALFQTYDLFRPAFGAAQHWIFASYAPTLLDGSAMKEMAGLARGLSDAGYPEALFARSAWLPGLQAAVLLALCAWVLARRAL